MRAERRQTLFLILALLSLLVRPAEAQTLFSYGNHEVSKEEFLRAFNKNNTGGKVSQKAYLDYLDLYIRYKLKVQAAYDLHLDTLATLITELQNFRNQMAGNYMNDLGYLNKLVTEAFQRSQKDIHLGSIFIASPAGDSLKAARKLTTVRQALTRGENFFSLAEKYSDDPFAQSNHGDLGYITVFTLPYALENLAYSTAPGKYSAPFKTKGGYFIFKNLGERKALGKIRAAQILLIFPLNATDAGKADVKQRADSIYQALLQGADFGALARQFSGDNLSYQHGGEMAVFGVGKYDEAFEKAAFALTRDGEISQPVLTGFGYHIIRRLARIPVSTTKNKETLDHLQQQIMNDPRVEVAKAALAKKILGEIGFTENKFDESKLWSYTDSALQNRKLPQFPGLNDSLLLFSFAKRKYTVRDWINYRFSTRNLVALNQGKSNRDLLKQFEESSALDYYRSHLEEYDKEFASQLSEFKDGNLLFEIMQRKVWDKASADSLGLRQYFTTHQDKYWWGSSAEAILITCSDGKTAENMKRMMEKNALAWHALADSSNGLAQADSGRYELNQLPPAEKGSLAAGQFSSMNRNPTDNSVLFAYILNVYPNRMPRNFDQARGMVVNDYQAALEEEWIAELKKTYPVKINQARLKTVPGYR